jgi:hypothetical protein
MTLSDFTAFFKGRRVAIRAEHMAAALTLARNHFQPSHSELHELFLLEGNDGGDRVIA